MYVRLAGPSGHNAWYITLFMGHGLPIHVPINSSNYDDSISMSYGQNIYNIWIWHCHKHLSYKRFNIYSVQTLQGNKAVTFIKQKDSCSSWRVHKLVKYGVTNKKLCLNIRQGLLAGHKYYRCNRLRCPLARLSGLQCYNMGHNGHGINLYGVIVISMGN